MPDNVLLLFQSPYSAKLNPAEKIWWKIKKAVTNITFLSQEEVSEFLSKQIKALSKENIIRICNFEYCNQASELWPIL